MKTPDELVDAIDRLSAADPEVAHLALDSLLIEQMPREVKLAVTRLYARAGWWAYA